jgi:hypothetical protein
VKNRISVSIGTYLVLLPGVYHPPTLLKVRQNQPHQAIIYTRHFLFYSMSIKLILAAAMVLGCCLVPTVSAFSSGCGGCGGSCGFGGAVIIPNYSKLPYWGMSSDDIRTAIMTARTSADTSATESEWPPKLVLPTPNANKFGGLIDYNSISGDAPSKSLFGSLTPVSDTKQSLISLQKKDYYPG